MATSGQFYWPSVGSSVAAYGQFRMATNTRMCGSRNGIQTAMGCTSILLSGGSSNAPSFPRRGVTGSCTSNCSGTCRSDRQTFPKRAVRPGICRSMWRSRSRIQAHAFWVCTDTTSRKGSFRSRLHCRAGRQQTYSLKHRPCSTACPHSSGRPRQSRTGRVPRRSGHSGVPDDTPAGGGRVMGGSVLCCAGHAGCGGRYRSDHSHRGAAEGDRRCGAGAEHRPQRRSVSGPRWG